MLKTIHFDRYVMEVLLPDLVGHDRMAAAFMVYVVLWMETEKRATAWVAASYAQLADATGLSKSSAQAAIRHLLRRKLISTVKRNATAVPQYRLHRHWRR